MILLDDCPFLLVFNYSLPHSYSYLKNLRNRTSNVLLKFMVQTWFQWNEQIQWNLLIIQLWLLVICRLCFSSTFVPYNVKRISIGLHQVELELAFSFLEFCVERETLTDNFRLYLYLILFFRDKFVIEVSRRLEGIYETG